MSESGRSRIHFILLCLLASCAKAPDRVSGQVYVALKNGESMKLGAVPVLFVETVVANRRMNELRSMHEAAGKDLSRLREAISKQKEENQRLETLLERYDKAWLYLTVGEPDIEGALRITGEKDTADIKRRKDELSRELATNRERLGRLEEAEKILAPSDMGKLQFYFTTNYPSLFSTTTDPEGKFWGPSSIPNGCSVIAYARRAAGEEIEDYFWFLPLTPSNRTNLLLNNQNLFEE